MNEAEKDEFWKDVSDLYEPFHHDPDDEPWRKYAGDFMLDDENSFFWLFAFADKDQIRVRIDRLERARGRMRRIRFNEEAAKRRSEEEKNKLRELGVKYREGRGINDSGQN